MKWTVAALGAALFSLLVLPAVPPSSAQEATYQIGLFNKWDTANLDVIIVPPKHGQIFNDYGVLNGGDPAEATPFNSYLKAIEASIVEWDKAVAMFGPDWLRANFQTNPYVVGRDAIPEDALQDPEIIITAGEHKGHIAGVAIRPGYEHCLIENSMFWTMSFSYADMYNVSAHEFGHCLGVDHVLSSEPTHDVMFPTYYDPVGAKDNHLHCVSTLDMKALENSYGHLFGYPSSWDPVSLPVSQYGTTCNPPSGGGEPTPSVSEAPPSEPTPPPSEPTPPPDPPAEEPEEDVFRTVDLRLSRHLVARGSVTTSEDAAECRGGVPVTLLRARRGSWETVGTAITDASGAFKVRLRDRPGRYQAEIDRGALPSGRGCTAASSAVVRHRHH